MAIDPGRSAPRWIPAQALLVVSRPLCQATMIEPRPNYRLPTVDDRGPTYAVWEVTLRCNQACRFCGTRRGERLPTNSIPRPPLN